MKNVIVIVIDALRPKNLGLYGYRKDTDPHLQKLAKESLVFMDHFSSSNSTVPSLTSLFTGKYPNNHGIIHQFPYTKEKEINKLRENKFWFPSRLQNEGYDTIAIDWLGMWFKKGFNYYEEKKEVQKPIMNSVLVKKLLLNLPSWAYKLGKKISNKRASTEFQTAEKTMDLAISKIDNSSKPLFLFMHFWDTHFPFPTTDFKATGENILSEQINEIKDLNHRDYFKKRISDINLNSIENMKDKYDAAISLVDTQIGRLINYLKKNNLFEKTAIVILGDHGDSLDEHNIYFSHSGMFDDSIHVPLIMHLPGFESKKISGMVQNIDIVPTIMDYLGMGKIEDIDGKSVIPLIEDGKEIRDKVFSFDGLAEEVKSVRTKSRKLVVAKNGKCNLCKSFHHNDVEEYDLIRDEGETNNIFNGNSELMKFIE